MQKESGVKLSCGQKVKKSAILIAEGQKEAIILEAEGAKQSAIKSAEGEAEAIRMVQQATADGLRMLAEAQPTQEVLTIKSLDAFQAAADGKATKLIIPSDIQGIAGLASSLTEIVKDPKEAKLSEKDNA